MATTPDAAGLASTLASNIGTQVVDTAVELAPVAVPFVLAITALSWVVRKFGMSGSAGLGRAGR